MVTHTLPSKWLIWQAQWCDMGTISLLMGILTMVKIGQKLTKQSEVVLFRNIFSKTSILHDFTYTYLWQELGWLYDLIDIWSLVKNFLVIDWYKTVSIIIRTSTFSYMYIVHDKMRVFEQKSVFSLLSWSQPLLWLHTSSTSRSKHSHIAVITVAQQDCCIYF